MYSWTTSLVLNGLLRAPPTLKAATNFATVGGGDASNNLIIRCSDVDAIFNVAAHRGQVKTTAKQWDGVLETFPSESDCTILQKGPRFEYEWASFGTFVCFCALLNGVNHVRRVDAKVPRFGSNSQIGSR
jgi:hypothetical protein